jgi:hypothetical protein
MKPASCGLLLDPPNVQVHDFRRGAIQAEHPGHGMSQASDPAPALASEGRHRAGS